MNRNKDRLLRPDQVAEILQVSKKSVYRRAAEGHFRAMTTGGSLRIWESTVFDYIEKQTYLFQLQNGILEKNGTDGMNLLHLLDG